MSEPARSESSSSSGLPRGLVKALDVARRPFEWIGRNELKVLVALLLLFTAVWAFVEIADEVLEGNTEKFDAWAVSAMRVPGHPEVPWGPPWFAEIARDLTALGGIAVLTLLTMAVLGFLWLRRLFRELLLVLAATLGGLFMSMLLKSWYDRPRPDLVPHLSHVMTSSFPSGHSMLSATVFLTLGTLLGRFVSSKRLKAYFLVNALLLTSLVGLSRVYLGVHYPTDVLAGWVAGLAWALTCGLIAGFLQRRGAVGQDLDRPQEDPADQATGEPSPADRGGSGSI